LSTGEAGFSYKLTQRLIFGEGYKPSLAQELPRGEARLFFLGQALSRGKGKTDGYHERIVPIPARARPALGQKARRDQLGLLARSRVERTEEARLKLLKPAICVLLQGAPEKLDFKDNRPQRWLDQLDQEVDRCFFDQLWNDMDLPPEEANVRWDQLLVTACWRLLQRATGEAPVPLARRYRAVASAENVFRGSARQKFPGASLSSLDRSHHDRTSEAT
jgi:CRISPR system Cascade subunit CasA